MVSKEEITHRIQAEIPGAFVEVSDMTGTGDHYQISVISESFEGQNLVQRHRRMHMIMASAMQAGVHAVKFKTQTPSEGTHST